MICKVCEEDRPETAFQRNRPGAPLRSTCRRCNKTAHRRRKGIQPRPPKKEKSEAERRVTALRKIRALLGKVLEQKCGKAGLTAPAVEYQARYRADETFREREIARTWARKAASGVGRTDGRTATPMHSDGTLTPSVVQALFAKATHCAYCTQLMHPRDKTLDHVVPVAKGGKHSITNAVIACRSCNSRKGARTPDQWLSADRQGDSVSLRQVA